MSEATAATLDRLGGVPVVTDSTEPKLDAPREAWGPPPGWKPGDPVTPNPIKVTITRTGESNCSESPNSCGKCDALEAALILAKRQREHRKSAAAERAEQARIDRAIIAERNRIVAWLRKEADAYGFDIDGCQTFERMTALELADGIEQGEHEQSHDDEVTRT